MGQPIRRIEATSPALSPAAAHLQALAPLTRGALPTALVPRLALTLTEAGQAVGLSEASIRRAVERGEIRTFKLGGCTRVRPEDVTAWVNGRANGEER